MCAHFAADKSSSEAKKTLQFVRPAETTAEVTRGEEEEAAKKRTIKNLGPLTMQQPVDVARHVSRDTQKGRSAPRLDWHIVSSRRRTTGGLPSRGNEAGSG